MPGERPEPKPDTRAPLSFELKPCRAPICSDVPRSFFELLSEPLACSISWDPHRGGREGGGAGPRGAHTRTFGWMKLLCAPLVLARERESSWGGGPGLGGDRSVLQLSLWPVPGDLPCDRALVALRAELLPLRAFLHLLPLCFPQAPPAAPCSAPRIS